MAVLLVDGNLLDQPVDAVVHAWNRNLIPWWLQLPRGGSGTLKRRAGHAPFRELGYSPLTLGAARHTSAGRLPHEGIIHVAALDGLWRATEHSIGTGTRSAVCMARRYGYEAIALPVLGAGAGFPEDRALALVVETLEAIARGILAVVVRQTHRGLPSKTGA